MTAGEYLATLPVCSCGSDHPAAAHRRLDVALLVLERELDDGNTVRALLWLSVARGLAARLEAA